MGESERCMLTRAYYETALVVFLVVLVEDLNITTVSSIAQNVWAGTKYNKKWWPSQWQPANHSFSGDDDANMGHSTGNGSTITSNISLLILN